MSTTAVAHGGHDYETDTGIPNGKLGTWMFLASEVMLFGGLISAYIILRAGSPDMLIPSKAMMGVPLATVNTLVLILSSVTVVLALAAIQDDDIPRFARFTSITIACGFIFLLIKAYEYNHKWHEGITISSNVFGSFYYTLTGLHVVHVIGGIALNLFILRCGLRGDFDSENHLRVECAGLYWHFVDLVWVVLFPILYLIH